MFYCILGLIVTTGISFWFAPRIFEFFKSMSPGVQFIYTEVTELWGTYFTVSLYSGVALAMPFLLYQMFMFVAPALTPKEKRYGFILLLGTLLFFASGIAFGYFVLLPRTMNFLINPPFATNIAQPYIRIGNYVSVATKLLLAIGIAFETPLIVLFLGAVRVVSAKQLSSFRRWAVLLAFVIAAVLTPTVDPINQTLVAGPIIVLYELGILLVRILVRQRPAKAKSTAREIPMDTSS